MDKKQIIDNYLDGRITLHPERLQPPTEAELDEAEKEFDHLTKMQHKESVPHPRRISPWWRWGAAAAVVMLTMGLWMKKPPSHPSRSSEVPPISETIDRQPSRSAREEPAEQPTLAEVAGHQARRGTPPNPSRHSTKSAEVVPPKQTPPSTSGKMANPTHALPAKEASEKVLSSSADSLNYYRAQLQKKMEAINDSLYMESIERLLYADIRLRQMVEHIVDGQAETAMQDAADLDTMHTTFFLTF